MIKYFYYLFLSLILVFLQQSVLPALGFLANLNILLVFLVFITIIFDFNLGFIFAIFIGFLVNVFSFLPLGTFIIIYLVILGVINFLYKHVFINFSFLTNLILIVLATFIFNLLLLLVAFLFYLLNLTNIYIVLDGAFLINFLWQIILNSIMISLVYILAKLTIKKLNLVFIIKK